MLQYEKPGKWLKILFTLWRKRKIKRIHNEENKNFKIINEYKISSKTEALACGDPINGPREYTKIWDSELGLVMVRQSIRKLINEFQASNTVVIALGKIICSTARVMIRRPIISADVSLCCLVGGRTGGIFVNVLQIEKARFDSLDKFISLIFKSGNQAYLPHRLNSPSDKLHETMALQVTLKRALLGHSEIPEPYINNTACNCDVCDIYLITGDKSYLNKCINKAIHLTFCKLASKYEDVPIEYFLETNELINLIRKTTLT